MRSKLAAWVIYKLFIYFSKNVSFSDFTKIYNEAYAAHVEAEWIRLQKILGVSYTNIKLTQDVPGGVAGVMQKGMLLGPTSPRLEQNAGQEEK